MQAQVLKDSAVSYRGLEKATLYFRIPTTEGKLNIEQIFLGFWAIAFLLTEAYYPLRLGDGTKRYIKYVDRTALQQESPQLLLQGHLSIPDTFF